MNIRNYTSSDKDACLAIFDGNCPPYFDEDERAEFLEWLEKPDRLDYYVVDVEGEVQACGGLYYDEKKDEVGFAWGMVANSQHGKGLGTHLAKYRIEEVEKSFPNKDCKLATSQMTREFYAKQGFVETEFEKDGFGEGIDKVTMFRFNSERND